MQNQGKPEFQPENDSSVPLTSEQPQNHSLAEMSTNIGMVLQLADGSIQACNPEAEALLGLTSEQMHGNTSVDCPWQTVHADGSPFPGETHPAMVALQSGKPCLDVVMGFYQPNGELIWLNINSRPLFQPNISTPYAVVTTFSAIAAQKETENFNNCLATEIEIQRLNQELERRVNEMQTILDTVPVGIAIAVDASCQVIRANGFAQSMLAVPADANVSATGEQAETLPFRQLRDGKDIPGEELPMQVATAQGVEVRDAQMQLVRSDGATFDCLVNAVPLFDEAGAVCGCVAAFMDISELKRTEESLRLSEERLRIAQLAAKAGTWDWDVAKGSVYWSPEHYTLYGTDPATPSSYENWLATIIEADREFVERTIRQALEQQQTNLTFEFRINHPLKGMQWFDSRSEISYDASGQPTRIIGISSDISDSKQIEADLIKANGILRSVIDGTSDVIFVKDLQGRYIIANSTAADWLGTTVEAMLNRDDTAFFSPEKAQQIQQTDRQIMQTGESITFEEEIPKQGIMRSLLSVKYPWRDAEGNIIGVIGISREISHVYDELRLRKQAEEALKNSENRFRQLTNSMPQMIWTTDASGELNYVSNQWLDYTGLTLEQTQNPTVTTQHIHPDDVESTYQQWQAAVASGTTYQTEMRLKQKNDDSYHWFLVRAVPIRDEQGQIVEWCGTSTDIDDRKRIEEELRQKNAILDVINESAPTPIFVKDREGRIIYANPATLEVLGKPASEVIGCRDRDLYPLPELGAIVSENDRRIMESGETQVVEESPDGIRTYLATKAPYHNQAGEVIGLIGISNDISDRVQLERDRELILQQEQAAREAAEKANRIKDEFLAVLSHELRSPLNPILGWSKLLLMGKVDGSKTTEAIATIERNAKLQSQLIEDLLDVSRILQGKLSLNMIPVTLSIIIRAAQETVRLAAEAKNIQIQTVLAPSIGKVLGDTGRLQQILWNLLSNAVKFTPVGGRVEIRLMEINHDAQIQISDTGKGINPDFLPHVFEHFRQEDGATTRKFGGLGLGLAIVRQLVELHGGTVFVNSPGEGQGATFTVRLPLLKEASLEANDSDAILSPLPVEPLSLAGLRIMVVDDEPDSRNFIAFVLQQEGAEVIALSSAIDALESIQQNQPDLLISDIGMPEMDGYMLIGQIRNQLPPQYRKLLAIALTAYAGEVNEHQVLAAGYQKHLAKPVEPKDLVAAVIRLVGDREACRGHRSS
jgi:PAS domain S-box-containing protein